MFTEVESEKEIVLVLYESCVWVRATGYFSTLKRSNRTEGYSACQSVILQMYFRCTTVTPLWVWTRSSEASQLSRRCHPRGWDTGKRDHVRFDGMQTGSCVNYSPMDEALRACPPLLITGMHIWEIEELVLQQFPKCRSLLIHALQRRSVVAMVSLNSGVQGTLMKLKILWGRWHASGYRTTQCASTYDVV